MPCQERVFENSENSIVVVNAERRVYVWIAVVASMCMHTSGG